MECEQLKVKGYLNELPHIVVHVCVYTNMHLHLITT